MQRVKRACNVPNMKSCAKCAGRRYCDRAKWDRAKWERAKWDRAKRDRGYGQCEPTGRCAALVRLLASIPYRAAGGLLAT